MAKIYEFLADGCEETEAICPVDILRRAGHDVTTVSITGRELIRGSHGIFFKADSLFEDTDLEDGDLFMLPGGGEGTKALMSHEGLGELLKDRFAKGKRLAAICAAPSVLGKLGLLDGKKATVYPGMEETLIGAFLEDAQAVTDGNITTGRGAGAAADYGFELVRVLDGEDKMEALKKKFVYEK
ncbi:MAG: DJ-1/PfpI family protein [Eubacteriales bacterium]|nr:DJ-1/PfpI family protein [Eubacteriales bacterium]